MSDEDPETAPRLPPSPTRIASVLLVAYVAIVAVIAFWPTPVDRPLSVVIVRALAWLRANGIPWLRYDHLEFTANVVLFVPLGLLATLLVRRGLAWLAPLACIAASALIEVTQAVVLPGRFSSVADVVANGLGGVIGMLLGLALARRPAPEPATPD